MIRNSPTQLVVDGKIVKEGSATFAPAPDIDPLNLYMPIGSPFLAETKTTAAGGRIVAFSQTPQALVDLLSIGFAEMKGLHRRGIAKDRVGQIDRGVVLSLQANGTRWSVINGDGEYLGNLMGPDLTRVQKLSRDPGDLALLVMCVETDSAGSGVDLSGVIGPQQKVEELLKLFPQEGAQPHSVHFGDSGAEGDFEFQHPKAKGKRLVGQDTAPLGSYVVVGLAAEDPDGSNRVEDWVHGTLVSLTSDEFVVEEADHRSGFPLPGSGAFVPSETGSHRIPTTGELVTHVDFVVTIRAERQMRDGKMWPSRFLDLMVSS